MSSLFKVLGILSLDGTNFQAGMTRAQAAVRGLGNEAMKSLKGQLAAAFSVGAVTMLTRRTMQYADTIDETAASIGVGVEKLQEWSFAAKQAGSSTEQLASFVHRLGLAAIDPEKQGVFAKMGIRPEGMTRAGLFESVSEWARGKSVGDVSNALKDLGLKAEAAKNIINLLQTDLKAAGEDARKLGAVLDKETTASLAKLNDQFSIMSQILYSQFGPALLAAGRTLVKAFGQTSEFDAWSKEAAKGIDWTDLLKGILLTPWGLLSTTSKLGENIGSGRPQAALNDVLAANNRLLANLLASNKKKEDDTIPPPDSVNKAQAATRFGLPQSNAQMRVGNFLGVGQSNMQTLAQEQLYVQRATMRAAQHIERLQRDLLDVFGKVFF